MKITEHDVLTGKTVEREATETEIANRDQIAAELLEQSKADLILAKEKSAVMKKLGLTADEVAALLS